MTIRGGNVGTRPELLVELLSEVVINVVDPVQRTRDAILNCGALCFVQHVNVGSTSYCGPGEHVVQVFRRRTIMRPGIEE